MWDHGHGGGKIVLLFVTVCVVKSALVMCSGFPSSGNTIGPRSILGSRTVEVFVTSLSVMFQFHQLIIPVVIGSIVNVVDSTVRATVVVTVGVPSTVTVTVVVQATSSSVGKGSMVIVVVEARVEGATMRFRGAIPVAVFDFVSPAATSAAM